MRIDAAHFDAVSHVAANLREWDVREFMPLSHAQDREELAGHIIRSYTDHPAGFSFFDDGEPVGIGAMVEARPNVVTLMFFATPAFARIALPLAKFSRNRLFPRYRAKGVHRIECVSIDGYDEAHRWIELVGLKHESVMRGYGRSGETYHQFAWVADAHTSSTH